MTLRQKRWVLLILLALVPILGGCEGCTDKEKLRKPGAPSNLVATAVSYNRIDLTWQDNSNNEDGFRVGCNIYGGSTYYEVADLSANTTSFAHSGLDPLTAYKYYIQAYNEAGAANSNVAEVTTLSGVEILDYQLGEKYGDAWVTGHARNNTNETLDSVTITVWFYDAGGIMLDSEDDIAFDVPPLTTWEFDCWAITLERSRVDHIVVEVTDVNIYSWSSGDKSKVEVGPETKKGLSGE